ncbi:MAG: hypothetical protein HF310_10650 [Ignavibacteria bacterium]|jgi:hypothetical protein|nr:hypothetical protein [Ignavibacteria bacterium]
MLKFIFSFIVFMHGFIHLLGFLKEWKISEVKELTGKTLFPMTAAMAKAAGLLWLLTCILFAAAAISYLMKQGWWWIPASVALIVSQALIITYWHDAKFGTIANVIILVMCVIGYGDWSFSRMVNSELPSFVSQSPVKSEVIKDSDISGLPPAVQKWLRRSNVIGKDMVKTVRLKQTGQMRTSPEGSWWAFKAEQYFTVDRPAFLWKVDVKANPFLYMTGRDMYHNGRGQMMIKVMSLVPVVDVKGKDIDQGAMLRFLAEGTWFPAFALSSYLRWEEVDSLSARATMTYGGIEASGVYRFNSDGDLVSFEAMRYYFRKEGSTLEKWYIEIDKDGYKEFGGMRIPAKSSVTWKLKDGDYKWLNVEVTEMGFNK